MDICYCFHCSCFNDYCLLVVLLLENVTTIVFGVLFLSSVSSFNYYCCDCYLMVLLI